MAQKKAFEVSGWLVKPDPRFAVVLIYGPDRGMVSERAADFARKTGVALDDPFSVVRLDASEADENGRLRDEAFTVPMFASKRLLWVRNVSGHKNIAVDVKELCASPPPETIILLEAGELKKGAPLRTLVEASPVAIALPCYADEARDLDRLIDEVLSQSSARLSLDARAMLKRNLGGDRLASRGEIEKLLLYAQGKAEISVEDVEALTGDVSDRSLDDIVDAVLDGRLRDFDLAFQRHARLGGQVGLILSAMMRQMQGLQLMRAAIDVGRKSPTQAVAEARPPVFFARKKTVESAVARFNATMIERSLQRLFTALLQTRRRADLAEASTRQACLGIAVESARSLASRSIAG